MKEAIHDGFNAVLRASMADQVNGPTGDWGLFGCYWNGAEVSCERLDSLNEVLWDAAAQLGDRGETGRADITAFYTSIATIAIKLSADACGVMLQGLRGLALVANVEDATGARVCFADAAFDDGYRHTVIWKAHEAAPTWQITSPVEADRSTNPLPRHVPDLLAILQRGGDAPTAEISEEQCQLNAELRVLLADRMADEAHAVFVILRTTGGWEIIPPTDLTERIRAKVDTGTSMPAALGEVASELEADPLPAIPTVEGVGTVTHAEIDGRALASLVAYCDGNWHAVMWVCDEAAPAWAITSVAEADPGTAEVIAAYARVTAAISGKNR